MKRTPSIVQQGKRTLNDLLLYKQNKVTFKTYKIQKPNENIDSYEVKHIREDLLNVSQRILAESIGVSVRTVQGWESGKSRPFGAARRLLHLMKDKPTVRKAVLN